MKRYAVCKIYGDGNIDAPQPWTASTGPFRPSIFDIKDNGLQAYSIAVEMPPADPQNGAPQGNWCLVVATGRDFRAADQNPDVDLMPDFPLSGKLQAVGAVARNRALTKLQARGISVAELSLADGYGEMIRGIGQKLRADFHEDSFDVAE